VPWLWLRPRQRGCDNTPPACVVLGQVARAGRLQLELAQAEAATESLKGRAEGGRAELSQAQAAAQSAVRAHCCHVTRHEPAH
jgi:hypothetical protein